MKLLVILLAILAIASSYKHVKTWTLYELIGETDEEAEMPPLLAEAFDFLMLAMYTGTDMDLVYVTLLSPSGQGNWTAEELQAALKDNRFREDYKPHVLNAQIERRDNEYDTGNMQQTVEVRVPAVDVSIWTAKDVEDALRSPVTRPQLKPYLLKASRDLKQSGEDTIGIVTPVGYLPYIKPF